MQTSTRHTPQLLQTLESGSTVATPPAARARHAAVADVSQAAPRQRDVMNRPRGVKPVPTTRPSRSPGTSMERRYVYTDGRRRVSE